MHTYRFFTNTSERERERETNYEHIQFGENPPTPYEILFHDDCRQANQFLNQLKYEFDFGIS